MGFNPCNYSLKIQKSTGTLNSQSGNSLGSVRIHSLTLSFTPRLPLGSQPCKPLRWSRAWGQGCDIIQLNLVEILSHNHFFLIIHIALKFYCCNNYDLKSNRNNNQMSTNIIITTSSHGFIDMNFTLDIANVPIN